MNRPLEQVERALNIGLFNVAAVCDGKVIGMGRLVGDGAMYWYLQEIIVLPEYQGRGIGKRIVNRLIEYIQSTAIPGTGVEVILSILVDTFFTRISVLKLQYPEIHNISAS